ncbi:MAG: hypothetical protein NTW50_03485 [Candidatus Berkelbacteria bacterium]|nr:hypothetical protein [Candidatus Berkelbacteria bacterium]
MAIAKGITSGGLPYRDFFDHKTPGIYFALFGIVKLFGNSVLVPKTFLVFVNLATVVFTFLIAKKIKVNGNIAAVFTLFRMIFFEGNSIIAEPFVILFLTISLYLLLQPRFAIQYFLAGLCLGISILFKQTAVVNLMVILLLCLITSKWSKLLMILLGAGTIFASVFLYIYLNGLVIPAYEQIILYNITSYPREHLVLLLSNLWPAFVLILPLWALFIIGLNKRFISNHLLVIAFAILPIPLFFIRHYPHYWLQIIPFVAIVAAYAYNKIHLRYQYLILAFIILVMIFPVTQIRRNIILLDEQFRITKYLNSLQEDRILTENQFSSYYFLSDKKPLNKYLYITEIDDWSEGAQNKTISDLQIHLNTVIIWPKDSNFAYAKNLQSYILDNYSIKKSYDQSGVLILSK